MNDPIARVLEQMHRQLLADRSGAVAEYIPQLALVDPELFGIALATMNGRVYAVGNASHRFTIQSVSKPFVYAMVLSELGLEKTLAHVAAEPSGEAFNAISLEPGTGRPANPMVNAGAIVTTSLVRATSKDERFERIQHTLSAFAGRQLEIDHDVYASESETGDKNRALAYLMRNAGSLKGDVDETLDVYFRQCSLLVDARDLAVMGATLANGGRNPRTAQQIVTEEVAFQVLTVMATCGMYDFSGEWLLRVGLPAKSGVSGALIATSPAQFGIGLFSPRLDARGNSVRGVGACQELSNRFDLHLMNPPGHSAPVSYLETTGVELRSSTTRTPEELAALEPHRQRVVIKGLQGDLTFACSEIVLRSLDFIFEPDRHLPHRIVLDVHRVSRVHRSGRAMLEALAADVAARGSTIVVVDNARRQLLSGVAEFSTLDDALRRCEDGILAERLA